MSAPKIDKRDCEDLLKQIYELAPFYVPEWKVTGDGDSGAALANIFAQMLDGVVKRLNQVPDKNLTAFLNMLGVKLLPAQQARVPVTFTLSEGTAEPVLIPNKTQVAAKPADGGDPVVFETERNMLATPAKLIDIYSINIKQDGVFEAPANVLTAESVSPFTASIALQAETGETQLFLDDCSGLAEGDILKITGTDESSGQEKVEYVAVAKVSEGSIEITDPIQVSCPTGTAVDKVTVFKLFEGKNLQEHTIYFGYTNLLNIENPVEIELTLSGWDSGLTNPELAKWEYYGERENTAGDKTEGWYSLAVAQHQTIANPSSSGKILLRKSNADKLKELEINGIENFWVRCAVKPSKIKDLKNVEIGSVKMIVKPAAIDERRPEKAYFTRRGWTLYLGDSNLFKIDDQAEITLQFSGWHPVLTDEDRCTWQYYGEGTAANGVIQQGWHNLKITFDTQLVLLKDSPGEFKELTLNGFNSRWIRCSLEIENFSEAVRFLDLNGFLTEYVKKAPENAGDLIKIFIRESPENFREFITKCVDLMRSDPEKYLKELPEGMEDVPEIEEIGALGPVDGTREALKVFVEVFPDILEGLLELYIKEQPEDTRGFIKNSLQEFEKPIGELLKKYPQGSLEFIIDFLEEYVEESPQELTKFLENYLRDYRLHELDDVDYYLIQYLKRIIRSLDKAVVDFLNEKIREVTGAVKQKAKMLPDLAFYNDIPVDPGTVEEPKAIYPFGERPRIFDTFYLGSQEVFSKKGSNATLQFTLSFDPEDANGLTEALISAGLSWEYWNGTGWVSLSIAEDLNSSGQKKIEFQCPSDIAEATISGQTNYWIRVRIANGDYGRDEVVEETVNSTKKYSLKPNFLVPFLTNLNLNYSPPEGIEYYFPERCLTLNNLEYLDRTEENKKTGMCFRPFYPLESERQAIYLGFDSAPLKGPISIFFSLEEQEYTEENRPRIEWEYLRESEGKSEWARLEVLDGTEGLIQSGTMEFIGLSDFAPASRFGYKLCWLRAVDAGNTFSVNSLSPVPIIKGIYPNTAWVIQAETLADEILGSSDGEAGQTFTLAKSPVISEEVWVNEFDSLSEGERKSFSESHASQVRETKDENGNTTEFWVKWEPADDFLGSPASARHYTIDRAFGLIQFGDGVNGAVPPVGTDNVKADYQAGGGAGGNISRLEIADLRTSIAFVDSVTNPEAASGGCDTESVEKALERGPQLIKHRNRAVTAEDFEWLARQASRSIARVKCLPNINDQKQREAGWVTIIIVPGSRDVRPQPSPQLKRQVEQYLREHAANVLAFPQHLKVMGPVYQEISIEATIVAEAFDAVPAVEQESFTQLEAFLHPLTGGDKGYGWEFGRLPHLSDFYALLEGIEQVDHVESLTMKIKAANSTQQIQVTANNPLSDTGNIPDLPYALVYSGNHKVTVKAVTG